MERYEPFLRAAFDQYMALFKDVVERDRLSFSTITFLCFFMIEGLGIAELRKFLAASGIPVARVRQFLLEFLFDQEVLHTHLIPQYRKWYDHRWVDERIVAHVLKWRGYVEEMIFAWEKKPKMKKETIVTVPEPFDLTKPKPKFIPLPLIIEHSFKLRTVPKSTFQCDQKTQKMLDAYRDRKLPPTLDEQTIQKNREEMKMKYENRSLPFWRLGQL